MYGNTIALFKGLDREFGYESYKSYNGYKEKITPLVAETNKDEDGFFRVGATFERTKNEAIGFGYNGITHYSSTYNRYVNNLLQKMGMAQAWLWSSYFGSTMVTDSIFSVRYVISERPVSQYYETVKESGSAKLYYNSNALSIGTAVNEQSLFNFQFSNNSFDTQNQLVKSLTNSQDDCFVNLNNTKKVRGSIVEYAITSNGNPVYGYFSTDNGGGRLLVNGQYVSDLFTTETNCIKYIGTFNEGESVTVTVENSGTVNGEFRYLNTEVFDRAVSVLKASELKVEEYHNGSVVGTVNAKDGDVLFTTIPYDKGWKAYVDGTEVELKTFADSLIAIPLNAGVHKIKMTFVPTGFTEGICISIIPTLLVLILLLLTKKISFAKSKK
ncbi:MAG: Bacterial membrane protein YfhO [Firmicutes bacterium ADurb.Bin419]|nr:MAG: Bacterial membrane protein YfhO [Firmicutes bacterium ADurb.Bin419]